MFEPKTPLQKWGASESKVGAFTYDFLDKPYTFFSGFSLISEYPHHLDGTPLVRGSSEHIDAGVDGMMSLLMFMRVAQPVLNGGKFIKTVNKVPVIGKEIIKRPKLRGFFNRKYNWFNKNIGAGVAPNANMVHNQSKKVYKLIHGEKK